MIYITEENEQYWRIMALHSVELHSVQRPQGGGSYDRRAGEKWGVRGTLQSRQRTMPMHLTQRFANIIADAIS